MLQFQVCAIRLQSLRPAGNLGGQALDLATSNLIAPLSLTGAQPGQIQPIHLQLCGIMLDRGTTPFKLTPFSFTVTIPPRSRGSMARGALQVHAHRAGAVELGLHRELVGYLERRLAQLPVRRRGAVQWHPAEVSVIASLHGPPDGPVRDAVLCEVLDR